MAANENEEFEFRLRAEREASAPPVAAPAKGQQDTSSKEALLKSGLPPVKEAGIDLPPGLSDIGGAAETAAAVGTGVLGSVVGPAVGAARRVSGATMPESEKTAASVSRAMTYEPRSRSGRSNMETIQGALETSKLAGLGPPEQMMAAGMPRLSAGSVPGVNATKEAATAAAQRPKVGTGAGRVTGELQRQREVIDAGKVGPSPGAASEVESAMAKSQGATGKFQDVLRTTKGRFDVTPAIEHIDSLLSGPVTDAGERAALNEVRAQIELAVKNAGGAGETTTGGWSKTPMIVENGRLVPSKSKGGIPINYIDNVRQSINRIINSRDATGKPLAKDTQRLLFDVRDVLLDKTPENYKNAIADIAVSRTALEAATPPQKIMGKLTTEEGALYGQDAQNVIETVFKSETPGKHLDELVSSIKHDPQALKGVREAYTDWLTKVDPVSELPPAKDLIERWSTTKDAVETSGLMSKTHADHMQTIIDDIRKSVSGGKMKHFWASTAGFFVGSHMSGHPIIGARLATDLASSGVRKKTLKALEGAVTKIASDPDGAALLAAPPTPANIERVRVMLPTDLAAMFSPVEARQDQPKPRTMQQSIDRSGIGMRQ